MFPVIQLQQRKLLRLRVIRNRGNAGIPHNDIVLPVSSRALKHIFQKKYHRSPVGDHSHIPVCLLYHPVYGPFAPVIHLGLRLSSRRRHLHRA